MGREPLWRMQQGAAGKVLEAKGMILKCAVQIGLREMPGVARLGGEAHIGQSQPRHQLGLPGEALGAPGSQPGGIGKGQQEQQAGQAKKD